MDDPSNKDSLDELEKKLYRRDQAVDFEAFRSRLSHTRAARPGRKEPARGATGHDQALAVEEKESMSLMKKLLIGSGIFFAIAIVLALLLVLGTVPKTTSDSVDISVSAPVSVRGGGVLSFQVTFKNNSRTDFEYSDITVDYPDGTRDAVDPSKLMPRHDETVGPLLAGESVTKNLSAVVYGDENEQKEVTIRYDYRPKGSASIFRREKKFAFSISSSPVALSLTLPREVNSNHEVTIEVRVASNSNELLRNVLVEALYPPGFDYKGSTLEPVVAPRIWALGDLAPGVEKRFAISGILEGQEGDDKLFRFTVGSAKDSLGRELSVPYAASSRAIAVRRPFLGVSLTLPGGGESPWIGDGAELSGVLSISSNLAEKLENFHAELSIDGKTVRTETVVANKGFYQSASKRIVWDSSTSDSLGSLAPDETVELGFGFDTTASGSGVLDPNRTITLRAVVEGTRIVEGVGREEIQESVTKSVKIGTLFGLGARAVYFAGPFPNTGPIPPKVDTKTTYTVIWSLTNSANSASGATVKAQLPPNVDWLGVKSPASENIVYNPDTREVLWKAGTLPIRLGYGSPAREAAFQVALTPSLSQKGTEPVLLQSSTASATDDFTKRPLESIKRELTTRIDTDPKFVSGQSFVK
ncbi:MAG: hypothetical protein V4674_04125 [Patescibacteria group bacterium]